MVNTHLYGLHLATGGAVLPEHDVVVVDEAHQLEDTIAATAGLEVTGGRFVAFARTVAAIIDDRDMVDSIEALGDRWKAALVDDLGRRLRRGLDGDAAVVRDLARNRLDLVMSALRAVADEGPGDVGARKQRAMKAATTLVEDLDAIAEFRVSDVAWVEGTPENPVLRVAPVDVAELLRDTAWADTTAVLTSATLPATLPDRLGLVDGTFTVLDVGSPFDYEHQALLYCAADLPDPRSPDFDDAVHDELEALITAAGGRTMALFTSYRALRAAVEALRPRLDVPVLAQDDLTKAALVSRFTDEPESLPVRHHGLLAGRRRAGSDAEPRHDRPVAVPPARRSAAAGPTRTCPGRRLPAGRPPAGGHAARPGHGTPDPHRHRPGRGGRVRPSAGDERQLPLGHRAGAATDASHT